MTVKQLFIANMRGIEKQIVEFHPQFNVLVGVNGKGKTTILESIVAVLARHMGLIVPLRDKPRRLSNYDILDEENFTDISLRLALDYHLITLGLHRRRNRSVEIYRNPAGEWRNWAAMFDYDAHPYPLTVYYTTDRAAGNNPNSRRRRTAELDQHAAYQGCLTDEVVNFGSLTAWFAQGDSAREGKNIAQPPQVERVLNAAQNALRLFLPDFEPLEILYNDRGMPNLVAKKRFEITDDANLSQGKSSVTLQIRQLSDGERGVLAMVFDLAKRLTLANPRLDDPIKQGTGVVLIDELELHLHPSWQRSIVENLRNTFPRLQFITTSHSPFVVQSLGKGELIDLDPQNFEAEYVNRSVEDITEDVFDVDQPQKSEKYLQMVQTAEEYYRLLENSDQSDAQYLEALKERLDELQMRYSHDPAFTAFLKFQREIKLGDDN